MRDIDRHSLLQQDSVATAIITLGFAGDLGRRNDSEQSLVSSPSIALKAAKQVINDSQEASLDAALAIEKQVFALLSTTDDMIEGVTAFRQSRESLFEEK